jgi:hypothetical protein
VFHFAVITIFVKYPIAVNYAHPEQNMHLHKQRCLTLR